MDDDLHVFQVMAETKDLIVNIKLKMIEGMTIVTQLQHEKKMAMEIVYIMLLIMMIMVIRSQANFIYCALTMAAGLTKHVCNCYF